MLGRVELRMVWATLIGLEELMQELDVLGRRRQTTGYGWLDVLTLRRKGRGGGGRGQEGRHGRGQWRAVDECGVVRKSLQVREGELTVGRGVFTSQAQWAIIDGLL